MNFTEITSLSRKYAAISRPGIVPAMTFAQLSEFLDPLAADS
jgi:hypothetical protein